MGRILPDPIKNRVGYGFFKKNPKRVRIGSGFYKKTRNPTRNPTRLRPDYIIYKITKLPSYIYKVKTLNFHFLSSFQPLKSHASHLFSSLTPCLSSLHLSASAISHAAFNFSTVSLSQVSISSFLSLYLDFTITKHNKLFWFFRFIFHLRWTAWTHQTS